MLPNGLQGLLGQLQSFGGMGGGGGLLSQNFGNWGRPRQFNYLQGMTRDSPFANGNNLPINVVRGLLGGGRQMITPAPGVPIGAPVGGMNPQIRQHGSIPYALPPSPRPGAPTMPVRGMPYSY